MFDILGFHFLYTLVRDVALASTGDFILLFKKSALHVLLDKGCQKQKSMFRPHALIQSYVTRALFNVGLSFLFASFLLPQSDKQVDTSK